MTRQERVDRQAWTAPLRVVVACALSGTLAALLGRAALDLVHEGPRLVDDLVALVVLTIGAGASAVLTLGLASLTVSAAGQAVGRSLRGADALARRLTPVALRRVLAAGVGVGLGLGGAVTAQATEADLLWVVTESATTTQETTTQSTTTQETATQVPTSPEADVTGATSAPVGAAPGTTAPATADVLTSAGTSAPQTRHVAGSSTAEPANRRPDEVTPAPTATVEVAAGDSLWSLVADHLGPDATDARIAHEWPRWYETNRDVVGADPHLIRPGQVLTVPQQAVAQGDERIDAQGGDR